MLLLLLLRQRSGRETPERDVVDNFLALFQVVFESVEAFSQIVILEIEESKSGIEIADEFGNGQRTLEVARSHAIQGIPGLTTENSF